MHQRFGLYGPSFVPAQVGRDYEASEYLQILGDLRDQFTVFSGISHPEIGGDHASEACFLTSARASGHDRDFAYTVSMDVAASQHVAGGYRGFRLMALSTLGASPAVVHADWCRHSGVECAFTCRILCPHVSGGEASRIWTGAQPVFAAARAYSDCA